MNAFDAALKGNPVNPEKIAKSTTTDGNPPRPGFENAAAPAPLKGNGQHEAYWILSEEELAKGFVRPVRKTYKHVGIRPKHGTRELNEDEEDKKKFGYILYEKYPEEMSPKVGRYWTKEQLDSGCDVVTTMSLPLAETWARDPEYYGATFCCGCNKHLPVGEFVWVDANGSTTEERLGSGE